MEASDLPNFFNDCGLFPSQEEIKEAWDSVSKVLFNFSCYSIECYQYQLHSHNFHKITHGFVLMWTTIFIRFFCQAKRRLLNLRRSISPGKRRSIRRRRWASKTLLKLPFISTYQRAREWNPKQLDLQLGWLLSTKEKRVWNW